MSPDLQLCLKAMAQLVRRHGIHELRQAVAITGDLLAAEEVDNEQLAEQLEGLQEIEGDGEGKPLEVLITPDDGTPSVEVHEEDPEARHQEGAAAAAEQEAPAAPAPNEPAPAAEHATGKSSRRRAHTPEGHFASDDPSTPDVNEAYAPDAA